MRQTSKALSKQTWKGRWCGRAEAESPLPIVVCVTPGIGVQPLWRGACAVCTMPLQKSLSVTHQESFRIQGFLVSKSKSSQLLSHRVGPVSQRIWMPRLHPGTSLNSTHRNSLVSGMPFLPLKAIQLALSSRFCCWSHQCFQSLQSRLCWKSLPGSMLLRNAC